MSAVNSRLISLIRKEFIQILRDPRTLLVVFSIPIMQLLMMGYAATNDVRNVPLVVFDQDRGPAARALLESYRAADYFRIAFDVQSESELRERIDDGDARAGLIIPPDYSRKIRGGGTAQVAFVLDGSDPTVGSTALSAAQLIAQDHSTQVLRSRLAKSAGSGALAQPIDARTNVWYNPDLVSAYFMVPGVIAQILYGLTSFLTATAVVRERERGTIEQLIVTPIRPWELIVGKILPYALLAFLNTLEVLALGAWLFDVPVRGDLGMILLLSILFLFSGLGIGLLASTIANTQREAMLTIFMTLLPSIFLSGFFFPLEAMPPLLQWISYIVPMRYYLVIIRSLLIKGVQASSVQGEIIALIVFAVVIMTLATLRFRKRLD
jgi:ABC-2 type transport system permease protein